MKRIAMRTVLIAAAIIVATVSLAVAAGTMIGWNDLFNNYDGQPLPKAAVDALAYEGDPIEVGPCTFTVRELAADPHIALSAIAVKTTDGGEALLCPDGSWLEPIGACGDPGDALAEALGVSPEKTWAEAAKEKNVPLYAVRALIEVAPEVDGGSAMEDPLFEGTDTLVYFCMPELNTEAVGDAIPVKLYLRVSEVDLETMDEKERWVVNDKTVDVPVLPLMAEKEYVPEGSASLGQATLEGIRAAQYATGVYLTASFSMEDGMSEDDVMGALWTMQFCDGDGEPFQMGISLSGGFLVGEETMPHAALQVMINADTMPETILVKDESATVTAK